MEMNIARKILGAFQLNKVSPNDVNVQYEERKKNEDTLNKLQYNPSEPRQRALLERPSNICDCQTSELSGDSEKCWNNRAYKNLIIW